MRYELLVEVEGVRFYLDTFEDKAISLNYDIANIRDISTRNSAYSKTISLPDSNHNREKLEFITNLSSDSSIDANKVIKAWIMVDTIQVFEGNLQLKKFQKNFKTGEFTIEVVVFADNDTFFTNLGDKYLTDIDFSEYNHDWTPLSVTSSWTGNYQNGYVYPLIDYGSNWVYPDVSGVSLGAQTQTQATQSVTTDEMYPSTYVRTIFDRIFSTNNFSYQSEFLDSPFFKSLIVPFNQTNIEGPTSSNKTFRVGLTGYTFSYTPTPPIPSNSSSSLTMSYNDESSPNGDPNNMWNVNEYTNTDSIVSQRFGWSFDLTLPPIAYSNENIFIRVYRSREDGGATSSAWATGTGNLIDSKQIIYNNRTAYYGYYDPSTYRLISSYRTGYVTLYPGENVRIIMSVRLGNSPLYINSSIFFNEINPIGVVNGSIVYNNIIPKKVKQKDFVLSLVKMFNLYIEPSKEFSNTLIIEPRNDYYASGVIKDWSKKVDLSQQISVDILADTQNKITTFTHKEDKDALNQNYKATYNEIYGQYDFDSQNDFAKNNKKVDTIFSPTPISSLLGSSNMPISVIVKDFAASYNTNGAGRLESNLRILQWGGMIRPSDYGSTDLFSFEGVIYDTYPYAGHLDNPYESTSDINFGQPINVYFPNFGITDNNLFNTYWYKTMYELTNKDSRLVTAYLYLQSDDIYNFRFNDKIYMNLDGSGQYYKVNKIVDYNPSDTKPCKVEFIRADEIAVNSFVPKYKKNKPNDNVRNGILSFQPTLGVGTGVVIGTGNTINGGNVLVIGDINDISSSNSIINGNNNTTNYGDTIFINGGDNITNYNVTNSSIMGDNNIIGTSSDNIYIFGDDNTVSEGVTSTYVFGSGVVATQSNSTYFGGNTIFSGTISGIGLKTVLDWDPTVYDTIFTIEENNNIQLGRDISGITGSTDSIIINSQLSTIVDSDRTNLLGGEYNISSGTYNNFLLGGSWNTSSNSSYSGIIGGINNINTGGNDNIIIGGHNSTIDSGNDNIIIGGGGNQISNGDYSLSGGYGNVINSSTTSFILGGSGSSMSGLSNTGIVLLDNFIGTQSDTLYTPNLYVNGTIYVDGVVDGISWRNSVDEFNFEPGGWEPEGYRIAIDSPATGDFTGHDGQIATRTATGWDFEPNVDGDVVRVIYGSTILYRDFGVWIVYDLAPYVPSLEEVLAVGNYTGAVQIILERPVNETEIQVLHNSPGTYFFDGIDNVRTRIIVSANITLSVGTLIGHSTWWWAINGNATASVSWAPSKWSRPDGVTLPSIIYPAEKYVMRVTEFEGLAHIQSITKVVAV